MKSSKKILLVIVGLVIVGVITGLMVLRSHALSWLRKSEAESNFKSVAVGDFEKLNFSNNWIVDIRQGNEYKVEVLADDNATWTAKLENINGTLYFKADTTSDIRGNIQAKVEVKSLRSITTMPGTKISLRDFTADSISLTLNGSTFSGYNNNFKYTTFETSGDVSLEIKDDGI